MDKASHRIISELMIQLGYAMGVIQGLSMVDCETYMMLQERMTLAYNRLEANTDRILEKIKYE
jgi:hypothetical protein